MLSLVIKGGPIMIPIILGSIFGLAIVIERFIVLGALNSISSFEFVQQIFRNLKSDRIQAALDLCEENIKFPIAAIFKVGIERRALSSDRLETILEQAGNNQIQRLERRLGALASIVAIEPLMGFLGTITGLIRAFMSWEKAGANVTVNLLAGGIYEAMITTAAGLTISIPLYLFYNYFINRIKYASNDLTNHAIQLIEILPEVKK